MLLPFMARLGAVVVSRCDVCFLSNSHFSFEWFTYVTNAAQVNPIWEKTSIFSAIIRQKVFIQGDWGEHERGEMQKTAYTNFTGQWRLNTWWIHIERSYSSGNCTPQIQKLCNSSGKGNNSYSWEMEKRPETKTEKTVRFGRKLEAQSTEQLLKFYSSNFSVRILAAHLKNETFPHAKGKIAFYVRENQTDAQLTKLAEKICANKVLRWKRTNISFEMQTSQFFPLANDVNLPMELALSELHMNTASKISVLRKNVSYVLMNNIYIFS